MVATILNGDGSVTKIIGGVLSTEQPENPIAPEPPAPQLVGPDPLGDAAHAVENLPDEATALARAKKLVLDQGLNKFTLGGILQRIKEEQWFAGHATFGELCEHEFGFSQPQGYRLIQVYNALLDAHLTWAEVEELGWSKVALMCSKLSPDKFSTRVEEFKAMTYLEAKTKLAGEGVDDGPPAPKAKILTFKPHDDQSEIIKSALDKCKKESGTKYDTVALEYICLDYISPSKKQVPDKPDTAANHADKVFVERLHSLGIAESLNRLAELDPSADPESLVIAFFQDTGAEHVHALFETAFPDHDI